jgi:cytochrome c oxidase assembly factor CtaG
VIGLAADRYEHHPGRSAAAQGRTRGITAHPMARAAVGCPGGSVAGMPAVIAHSATSYHGPPELTVSRAFSEWVLDPWALAFILLLAVAYLVGVRRVRQAGQSWGTGRVLAFCGLGLGFAVIATMSFVAAYRPVLFYARAAQTVVLLLVVPLFLALGRPLSLAIAALPRAGPRIERAITSRTAKVVLFPVITTLVLVVTPFLFYFTSWYAAGLHSALIRELTYLVLMTPGFVFFWTLLRVDPVPRAYPYVVSLWISGAEVIGDAILGLAIIADPNLIAAAYYHAIARPWGPSLATDQILGGGTIWVLGDIVGLPFLVAQLIQMIREDEADAKVVDAELDAAELDAAAAADAAPAAAVTTAPRPWWESDARFAERFQPVDDSAE